MSWGSTCPSGYCPQACTLLLLVLFVYDVFFVFITPFLTKVGAPARALLPRPCPRAPPL